MIYGTDSQLGIASIVVFFSVAFTLEVIFRIIRKKETPFKKPSLDITCEEFENLIKNGKKLVILDDLVLDVSSYMKEHPGGKFLVETNIGRDISKFFYGGYSMENYSTGKPKLNIHSNIARLQVNTIVYAKLVKPAVAFQATIIERHKVNSTTNTIVF